ncbi:MAG: carbohydrate-binding family 9-like protein [Fimbriimonas sp.]|nr:carbohydrate-binding family 9-like protein [Fimbriimonas sp.]
MSELTAHRVHTKPSLDGSLSDRVWQTVAKSNRFVDMATGEPAIFDTRCALLYDDENLYIGFWVEEPYPAAHQTERDSLIFRENDVEVFIDGGDCYYEFEINALNTVYEVFFIWRDAYKKDSRFDLPEFDLHERAAYTFGGNFDRTEDHFWKGTHPRGIRWAFLDWDLPGLQTAVHIDGTLNDRSAPSKGWSTMLVFPWSGMKPLADGRSLPPKPGDVWKLFLGRFQKLAIGSEEVQAAWCATPHGVYDTHMPDKFTPVRFGE